MTEQEVLDAFREAGALLEGHFIYASGRHGRQFLQAARVLQYPEIAERLCAAMAEPFKNANIDLVVGPATGGIILAYETARHLECRAAFTEKENNGAMALKRGFRLNKGERVLVVEDIATTGGSVKKSIAHLRERGVEIAGVAVLIDRSAGEVLFDCPYHPLARLDMQSWDPANCALCQAGTPIIDPDDIVLDT
ncbi:MAG: orotate phosphoribosyltransferase [Candidatus Hydrogenedentota bacterium]